MKFTMRFTKYFIVVAMFLLLGIVYARVVPKAKTWMLAQIELFGTQKSGFDVQVRQLNFTFLPPGVELEKLKLTPQKRSLPVSPVSVDALRITLNPFALLTGRFEIGEILLVGPKADIDIAASPPSSPSGKHSTELPWNDFINLPLQRLVIKHGDIRVRLEEANKMLATQNLNLNLEKSASAAKLEIFSPQTQLLDKSQDVLNVGIATRIILEKQAVELAALKLAVGENIVLGRGVARGEITKLQWTTLNFHLLSHMDLANVLKQINPHFDLKLPQASGELNFEVVGSTKKNEKMVAALELNTKDIQYGVYRIGNVQGKIKVNNNNVTTDQIKVHNSAGDILVNDVTLSTGPDAKFSARIQSPSLQLETLLENLGIPKPNLHLDTFLKAACEGHLTSQYKITCAGETGGKNFRVFTEKNKTIAALKEFKILTRFVMENNIMTFPDGTIQVGSSSGIGNGSVDFEKGFNFNFATRSLNFADIQSLADFDYQGSVSLNGTTRGNGHSGTISAHVGTSDFWFENYHLGKGDFDFDYVNANLHLTNIDMGFAASHYTGKLDLSVSSPGHIATDLNFSTLNLAELSSALSKKAGKEYPFQGVGSATLHADGPLALSALNYKLSGKIASGSAFGETFQALNFDLHAINGHVYTDSVNMKKGDGSVTLTGDITQNGIMSLFVKGRDLHISDFDHVKSIINGFDGLMQIDMSLQDQITDPTISLRGLVAQTTINQEPLENSSFAMELFPASYSFKANLFADKVKFEVRQPRKMKAPSLLTFDTEKWDFSQFLSALAGSEFKRDYETNLTAHVNLSSETGDFLEGRGSISVPELFIRHGIFQLRNSKPISIKFNDGFINVDSFALSGDNTNLKVSGSRTKKDTLNFSINGNMELSLFNFLTPFFKEMRGTAHINAQIAGTSERPDFLGTALLSKAYFKLKEFPHDFEDINADILFSQNRLVLNKLKGTFAGGDLTGNGSISFRGMKDIPVDVNAEIIRATFNVPEGLTTKGSGQIKITGNTFPYTIQADYNIESGSYTKNFGDQVTTVAMKRSAFLPKGILQNETSTLELDLNAHFPKPVSVKNSLVETDVTGDLNVRGDPKHVILKGEIDAAPGGKLYFHDTPFTINVAKLKFNNPNENNPNIYTLATTRLRDWDITLLYQGTLDKYELRLSSSPPLPEKSIISLLALGITDDNLEKSKQDQLAMQGYQAGGVLLSQTPLVQEVKKKSGVNVRLSQTVDDTRNIVLPKFVAEKQWTPKFSTSIGKTFGDRSSQDFTAEYKLNRNFSVLGSYERRDYDQYSVLTTNTSTTTTALPATQTDVLGLDLQYQVEFK